MYNILTYHNGNGLTVYWTPTGDIVAHISPDREVNYRKAAKVYLEKKHIKYIEEVAKTDDRNISITQDEKVFNTRPNENS